MLDQIKRFDYRYLIARDETARVAEILAALTDSGADLLAFSDFPHSRGKLQVDLITADTELLARTAQEMGWKLSPPMSGFLNKGDGPRTQSAES